MERDNDVAELSIDEDTMCTSLLACIENIWIVKTFILPVAG